MHSNKPSQRNITNAGKHDSKHWKLKAERCITSHPLSMLRYLNESPPYLVDLFIAQRRQRPQRPQIDLDVLRSRWCLLHLTRGVRKKGKKIVINKNFVLSFRVLCHHSLRVIAKGEKWSSSLITATSYLVEDELGDGRGRRRVGNGDEGGVRGRVHWNGSNRCSCAVWVKFPAFLKSSLKTGQTICVK